MKKIFTLAIAAFALTATAATQREQLKAGLLREAFPTQPGLTTLKLSSASPLKTEPEHQWVAMGEGVLHDDITNTYFYNPEVVAEDLVVDVQMDAANEGWYRIVNPWKNFTQMSLVAQNGGTLVQSDDITIVIDASNPDYVRVMETNIGMDDGYGMSNIVGLTEMVGAFIGYTTVTQAMADAAAGKLVDGIITFTGKQSLMLHQGDDYYNGIGNDKVTITLPEFEQPIDYEVQCYLKSKFCPSAVDGKYHVTFAGDNRLAGVKYLTAPEYPEGQAAINALIDKLEAEGTTVSYGTDVAIDISGATGPEYFIFFHPVDENGGIGEGDISYLAFWVPDTDTEGWTSIGNATMTEGLISCLIPDEFDVEDFQVEVQRSNTEPGVFRIVNPYNPWQQGQSYLTTHDHNHYIYFNAEKHSNVYILESGLGLSLGNFGEVGIGSDYYNLVRQYGGTDFLEMFDILSGGTIEDNVLTFNGEGDIRLFFMGLNKWVYTNLRENPDYDPSNTSPDNWRNQYLGGDFKLDMTGLNLAGITDITPDEGTDAPAEYFNLQGIRVLNPQAGGVYILRRGSKATKVLVR